MGIFKKKAASEFDKPRDQGALKIMKEGNTVTRLSFLETF